MKKLSFPILFILFAISACKKNAATNIDGCINRVETHSSTILLSATDQAKSLGLFQQNHIIQGALQFYRYGVDNNAVQGPYQYVSAHQYFNDLLLFNADVSFTFRQGVFISTSGGQYATIGLDANPHLSLADVRAAFLAIPANAALKDSCLKAQFGYWNIGNGSGTPPENFVKAWKVTLKNPASPIPTTYLRDDNGKSVFYDDGLAHPN